MKTPLELKTKLINHLMVNGNKKTSEKILTKSFKKLQKDSKKQSKKLFQLAITNSIPLFKFHIYRMKKRKKKKIREVPVFIANKNTRISLAIKFMLSNNKKNKKSNKLFNDLKEEIFLASQQKGTTIEAKTVMQKQILLKKKHLFSFYKWKKK